MIKVKGKKGLQKQALLISIVTPKGEEIPLAIAETPYKLVDKRKKRNKRYVELIRFGKYPYIAVTKNVVTGRLSWVVRAGQHHYWLPLDTYDLPKLLDLFLYSYTLEYKSIDYIKIKIPKSVSRLRMKVAAAKAAYLKHLKAKRRWG
ncbi:MAG: hypothetical protein QXK24_02140 [Ignisphaera sp.]